MGIKFSSKSNEQIGGFFTQSLSILEEEISKGLAYLGEQSIIFIRDRKAEESWFDHTGNLRSSTGYSLYSHGLEKMTSSFKKVLEGSEGASAGKKLATELASKHKTDFALVLVAGMEYASNVEDIKGKDVLASAKLYAQSKVDENLKKSIDKAMKRINEIKI